MSDTRNSPQVDILRSPLGRARGLGAARSGSRHWWVQRLSGIALVPLTLWFIFGVIGMAGASRLDVQVWLASPITMTLMLALIIGTFHHLQLGLQVVIEDYVHDDGTKLIAVLLMKGLCMFLALACIVSVLSLGL
ncbi:MAG: succinate dehydrogenase, hydrophobic membrane anchor protein [Acetobacteraceae bacterium]